MHKLLVLLLILGFCGTAPFASGTGLTDKGEKIKRVDEEYDRYRKRGDAYFAEGDYLNAIKQYRNCLEVPTFEKDPYALGRIDLAQKLITLRGDAQTFLAVGKGEQAVSTYNQILTENPEDSITKVSLTDYWVAEANQAYTLNNYEEAKKQYEKALLYARKPELIQVQIRNCEEKIKTDRERKATEVPTKKEPVPELATKGSTISTAPPEPIIFTPNRRRLGPKILTAAVGIAAGAYAFSLNNQYKTKLSEANRLATLADPDGDNIIVSSGEYDQWKAAYQQTKDSQSKRSLFMTSLGVAGAAAVTEIILLVLPKSKKNRGIDVGASRQHLGVALRYTFKEG